jgi:putative ABC transport system substrate-binding protein
MKPSRSVLTVVFCIGLLVAPHAAAAQQAGKRVPRIGWLSPGIPPTPSAPVHPTLDGFLRGLRELGYIEGQTILVEYRYAEGKFERFPDLAADLARLKVDVIVTGGGPASLKAAREASSSIPIVMAAASTDPVREGYVTSLARPGGNVTGIVAAPGAGLAGKRLELLKEVIPGLERVAILWDANTAPYVGSAASKENDQAARSLRLQLLALEVRDPRDFDGAVTAAAKERAGALLIHSTPLFSSVRRAPLVELATRYRLPTISSWRDFAEEGGLMSYGAIGLHEQFRLAARYVDRILKGAKPGDLPVEQPTKFELVINLRTAKAIGLSIPPSVLARADHLIE